MKQRNTPAKIEKRPKTRWSFKKKRVLEIVAKQESQLQKLNKVRKANLLLSPYRFDNFVVEGIRNSSVPGIAFTREF